MKLAISPCPNDTFLFEEFLHDRAIFDSSDPDPVQFLDIAELNTLAASPNGPDLVKVSCASVPLFLENYRLLPCGGAMGEGCGPLLLKAPGTTQLSQVALPGHGTTAHVLFRFWLSHQDIPPSQVHESLVRFDMIPKSILEGKYDHGVVIHETRFTFQDMGLAQAVDLGEFWERKTNSPIPLGALLLRRDHDEEFAKRVVAAVGQSLDKAWSRPEPVTPWIASHAQEMAPQVQRNHIATYVTPYSKDIGERGLAALETLWNTAGDLLSDGWPEREVLCNALQETARLRPGSSLI
jgi:1,4-dihydroxy-6-naphthoate synthase